MSERDELYEVNMQLLMNAMNRAGQVGATFTLPEPVMLEYARLLRADEREACAAVCDELVTHTEASGDREALMAAVSCAVAIRARGEKAGLRLVKK